MNTNTKTYNIKQNLIFFRSINELERLSKDVKHKILEIERMFGTIEELRKELKEKEAKCGKDIHLISKIEKNYQVRYSAIYRPCHKSSQNL